MADFREKCEAFGEFINNTEGFLTTVLVCVIVGSAVALDKINSNNSGLLQALTGGGIMYGAGNIGRKALDRRRESQTNIRADQADVIVNHPEPDEQTYHYNPPSVEPLELPRGYVRPNPADLDKDIGIELPSRPRRDPTNQKQSKFLGE